MAVLLITYDCDPSEQDCEKILDFIKSSKTWAKLSEYSYAIQSEETPQEILQKLTPCLSDRSRLFVFNLTRPYAGIRGTAPMFWLEKMLA